MIRITILFLFVSFQSIGQNWVEPGASWNFAAQDGWSPPIYVGYEQWQYTSDTLIDSQLCQRIEGVFYNSVIMAVDNYQSDTLWNDPISLAAVFIYTEEDRTYFHRNGTFHLLADFGAQPGEQWSTPHGFGGVSDYMVTVDSVGVTNEYGISRRIIHAHLEYDYAGETYEGFEPIRITEGLSFDGSLIPEFEDFTGFIDIIDQTELVCFESDITPAIELGSDCTPTLVSLEEYEPTAVDLYPNPTTGLVHIRSEDRLDIESVKVLDALGQEVLLEQAAFARGSDAITVNLSTLPQGVYFIQVISDQGIHASRVLKE